MVTLKEIVFLCASILDDSNTEIPLKHNVYNQQTEKVSVLLTTDEHKKDMLNGCIDIGQKAISMNIDPIIAIAVGYHESQFYKNIIGGGSIGMMQVIPKYWCRLETEVEDWNSPSQYLWIPIKPRPDKCRKKKLRVNHYMNEDCISRICDLNNCVLKTCDLERAGVIALLYVKSKNTREMLFKYNKGLTCDRISNIDKKNECIKSGYKYADSVLSLVKKYNKRLKVAFR